MNQLNCEQVYNIWATEPELIEIVDLRSREEFAQGHIPGALNIKPSSLMQLLGKLESKLAVLIAAPEDELTLRPITANFENVVWMSQCHRWQELSHPIVKNGLVEFGFSKSKQRGLNMNKTEVIFQQLFEPASSTYSYLIADAVTREAAIVDPVLETVDRDLKLIDELGLKLIYVLDTHVHADHITGAAEIKKRTGCKVVISRLAGVSGADVHVEDGQELLLGNKVIRVISTPGHTDACTSYHFEGVVFTGDALLIRGCGRTDFQQGDAEKLFHSVREKLFQLPDDTIVYPGHDYRGFTASTIGSEKRHNPRLKVSNSLADFKNIMMELKLEKPKRIDEAVPANLNSGRIEGDRILHPQIVDGVPEISVEDLYGHMKDVKAGRLKLLDVRRPDEFNNELGHIEGSVLVTLGPELNKWLTTNDKDQEIVFICRSGGRSGNATIESIRMGYKKTINMSGGMLRWNEKKLPVERNN